MIRRRSLLLAAAAVAALVGATGAQAADKIVKIGIAASLTGGDAQGALLQENGVKLAIMEANAKKEVPGVKFEAYTLDDGTATAGQYDPAQAAINARKFASDKAVIGIVGPQMSGAAKAMLPILSQANLPMITPSATNPDMTDPKFAAQFKPAGKTIFFRTVATDAYQGPYLANYFADVLKVKTLFVLDDTGAYGEGIANAFQAQAEKKGIKILGRDKVDPKAADYSAVLTKIKSLNPDALFYGGVGQAGVKVVKQSYDILPNLKKGGGDGLQTPEILTGAGFPAAEGWYSTVAAPHVNEKPELAAWVKKYKETFKVAPDDYAVCAYDAALAMIAAAKKVHAEKKPLTHDNLRDALMNVKVNTLQGEVAFDEHGDIKNKVVSVFQFKHNPDAPIDDLTAQGPYIGVAPQS